MRNLLKRVAPVVLVSVGAGAWVVGCQDARSPTITDLTGPSNTSSDEVALPLAAPGTVYGLEWSGSDNTRRQLYWHNPFPIYDATYIFKVYPRKKTSGTFKYYTTFFWGNDGLFEWNGGRGDTYYGAHPYPVPSPGGPGRWEIAAHRDDITTNSEVGWDRWYTQAFRAWRTSATTTRHEFYWDLPDLTKVITFTINDGAWAHSNPPTPAIMFGQAPEISPGTSWGLVPGYEEFKGVIRGIQMYSDDLSLTDIVAEASAPMSTTAGRNAIWYLNTDPRPGDVRDKKGIGTPHDGSWAGTAAAEWSDAGSSGDPDTQAPSRPGGMTAKATSPTQVSASWTASTDDVGVVNYRVLRCQGSGCAPTAQVATTSSTSYQNTGLSPKTTYRYAATAVDAAGNVSVASTAASVTTPAATDTQAPSQPGGMTAKATSPTQVTASWTASTDNVGVVNYRVLRCQGSGCAPTAQVATTSSTSYQNTGLSPKTTYRYAVSAVDAAGNVSAASTTASVTTPAAQNTGDPSQPTGITAKATSPTLVTASWTASTASSGVVGYGVQRCQGSGCTPTAYVGTTTSTSYQDKGLSSSTTYRYAASAVDAAGHVSAASTAASVTTPAAPAAPPAPDTQAPKQPGGMTAKATSPTQVSASWTASTDNVGVVNYRVLRCQGSGCAPTAQVGTTSSTSYQDKGLSPSTTYRYAATAVDAAGNVSAASTAASVTTPAAQNTGDPSQPTGMTAKATSPTLVSASWTASTASLGVVGYGVLRCRGSGCTPTTYVGTTTSTSYQDNGLSPSTTYRYAAAAVDAAGHVSAASAAASVTTSPAR